MKTQNKTKTVIIIVFIIFLLINIYIITSNYIKIKNLEKSKLEPELRIQELNITYDPFSLSNYTKVNISTKDKNILLQSKCYDLKLITNDLQLYSIEMGLDKNIKFRPTTHDVMKAILDNYNITLLMVKIEDTSDEIYFSSMFLKRENEILNIDTKSSDSIALAIRTNSPVYIKDILLEKYGNKTCQDL